MNAAANPECSREVFKLLTTFGADVNLKDKKGMNVVYLLRKRKRLDLIREIVIPAGFDFSQTDDA